MCDECHQNPHATMCPNGTPMVDVIYVDCALCGAEVDEETTNYGICEKCWADHHNFDNALAYGETAQVDVKVNGLYAKVLTPEQIDVVLSSTINDMRKSFYASAVLQGVREFLADDDGDFAGWLKEQKNID